MAPAVPTWATQARELLTSAVRTARSTEPSTNDVVARLGPLAARSVLLARDGDKPPQPDPHKGAVNFKDINNAGMFVLFALIGVGFVITIIWFFFWAKNGGFYFKENDWEDYKSTVLRRKGPNGTILSGATPSTQLGGGSVYKDYDDVSTEYTGGLTQMTGDSAETGSTLTGITGGVSDFVGREKRREKRERKEREREKKKDRKNRERSAKRRGGEDGVLVDEMAEATAQDHLRAYRHEKPARVGGINKASEGSEWDGSTHPDNSTSASSDLLSHRDDASSVPPSRPSRAERQEARKNGGIRKVYSTADRTADREQERMRAEAKRQANRDRSAGGSSKPKRDFSFQRAETRPTLGNRGPSTIEEEADIGMQGRYLPVGSYAPESDLGVESDLGTKSYHHVIPGLSSSAGGSQGGSQVGSQVGSDLSYQEEKRKKRSQGRHRQRE
ncbi:uncharacterized protein B0I36DRAFT_101315 [Microdochium trichocladiopsis]|uniref:Endosomal spry domain-containing protein n=1 Tax=Microdochium trichocladiopsis TaxID=1682393 RepID=A0A9P9BRL0_9PEZI|nr:uncharacterized protein B0I36DRAFT_101315 [Microdochium trichocladiopsis]KAH7032848.1 hypothetical protein B0I36DRAFT_101315 [Microdochium trichocladiopsis]